MASLRRTFSNLAKAGVLLLAFIALAQANPTAETPNLVLHEGVGGRVETNQTDGEVVLTAVADNNYRFSEWECLDTIDCPMFFSSTTNRTISFTGTEDVAIKANFELTNTPPDMNPNPAMETSTSGVAVDTTLELRGAEGGSLSLVADCGTNCAAGNGWTATITTVVGEGYDLAGWRWSCVDSATCPRSIGGSDGNIARFTVSERLVVEPELTPFSITTTRSINFQQTARGVQEQALCSVQDECLYLTTNSSTRLRVDALQSSQRSYEWSILDNGDHLSFSAQDLNAVDIAVGSDLSEIVVSTIAVESTHPESSLVARDTIKVVAIPSALAVQLGGCSGFVARAGENYYVVTAGHCLDGLDDDTTIMVEIGLQDEQQRITGEVLALDEVGDVGVIRIPNPNLDWVPEFTSRSISRGERLRVIGRPHYGLVATAAEHSENFACSSFFSAVDSFATESYRRCEWNFLEFEPDPGEGGFSGGAILDSNGRVVGVLTGAVGSFDSVERIGRGTRIVGIDVLRPLLAGDSRCVIRGEHTFNEGMTGEFTINAEVGVDNCSMRR